MRNVIRYYKDIWEDLNLFGKLVIFPFLLCVSPILLLFEMGMKDD